MRRFLLCVPAGGDLLQFLLASHIYLIISSVSPVLVILGFSPLASIECQMQSWSMEVKRLEVYHLTLFGEGFSVCLLEIPYLKILILTLLWVTLLIL